MKNILINGLLLNGKLSGVQYYIKNLLDEYDKIQNSKYNIRTLLTSQNKENIISGYLNIENFSISAKNRIKRIIFEHFMLPKLYAANNELLHAPGYILPFFWKKASVLTVHDLIALDYPLLCQSETAFYFKLLLPYSIKKATRIIAVSNKVKEDILNSFDIEEEKIHVVYHGISKQFKRIPSNNQITKRVSKKSNLPRKYILFACNIEPKKNLFNLIKAFQKLKTNEEIEHQLVIVGKKGWKYKSFFKKIMELKIEKNIIFTGYIPEEDLPAIYSMADLFVFPSLYEGFGIPPLEAMACEVPVIVSDKGALPEITGGKCKQVDPYNINEMAKGIFKLITDSNLRERSIQEGKKWVKQFSLEKAAIETLRVYEEAINA